MSSNNWYWFFTFLLVIIVAAAMIVRVRQLVAATFQHDSKRSLLLLVGLMLKVAALILIFSQIPLLYCIGYGILAVLAIARFRFNKLQQVNALNAIVILLLIIIVVSLVLRLNVQV